METVRRRQLPRLPRAVPAAGRARNYAIPSQYHPGIRSFEEGKGVWGKGNPLFCQEKGFPFPQDRPPSPAPAPRSLTHSPIRWYNLSEVIAVRKRAAAVCNAALAALILWSWLRMALGFDGNGQLTAVQWGSLQYFTVLSNLLCAAACIAAAVCEALGKGLPLWAARLKLAGTTAVGLTFAVVVAFLGQLYGYANMFKGGNLYLHGVNPVAAWLILILLEREPDMTRRDAALTLLPPLAYAVFYFGRILLHGREGNDFYAFALWGWPGAVLIVLIIGCAVFGMANIILRLRRGRAGQRVNPPNG